AYRSAETGRSDGRLYPFLALNRLALDALTPWESAEAKDAAIALAQRCRQVAVIGFAASPSVGEAAMQADSLLVERLIDGSFGAAHVNMRQAALEEVA